MAKANEEHVETVSSAGEKPTADDSALAGADGRAGTSAVKRRSIKTAAAKRAETSIRLTPTVEAEPVDERIDQRKTRRNPTARKKDRQVGSENAAVVLSLLDGLAVMILGDQAVMNEFEKLLIAEPLERIMARMTWETGETVNRWMDPIMLVIGLITWGTRLTQVAAEKRSREQQLDDGIYGPKRQQTRAVEQRSDRQQASSSTAAPSSVYDLGESTSAGLTIGRDAERVNVDVGKMP